MEFPVFSCSFSSTVTFVVYASTKSSSSFTIAFLHYCQLWRTRSTVIIIDTIDIGWLSLKCRVTATPLLMTEAIVFHANDLSHPSSKLSLLLSEMMNERWWRAVVVCIDHRHTLFLPSFLLSFLLLMFHNMRCIYIWFHVAERGWIRCSTNRDTTREWWWWWSQTMLTYCVR